MYTITNDGLDIIGYNNRAINFASSRQDRDASGSKRALDVKAPCNNQTVSAFTFLLPCHLEPTSIPKTMPALSLMQNHFAHKCYFELNVKRSKYKDIGDFD